MESGTVAFTKMHNAGNDYIYVDTARYPLLDAPALSVTWSAAHTGIGSDGLVLVGPSSLADFSMRMYNADGSEALMCGNAALCVGKFVYDKKLTNRADVILETLSGVRRIQLNIVRCEVDTVTVDMGQPAIEEVGACVEWDGGKTTGMAVSMGNPHFVSLVSDVHGVDLEHLGPLIEHHPRFPLRTNAEFAQVCQDGSLRMRVWERGSGVTRACGSGACAAAVAAITQGLVARSVRVQMDGGAVHVDWTQGGAVHLTGSPVTVFDGVICLEAARRAH